MFAVDSNGKNNILRFLNEKNMIFDLLWKIDRAQSAPPIYNRNYADRQIRDNPKENSDNSKFNKSRETSRSNFHQRRYRYQNNRGAHTN